MQTTQNMMLQLDDTLSSDSVVGQNSAGDTG